VTWNGGQTNGTGGHCVGRGQIVFGTSVKCCGGQIPGICGHCVGCGGKTVGIEKAAAAA
jgi:hypothetical protein